MVPYPVRRLVERTLGLDAAFAQADPAARRRYDDRLRGSDRLAAGPGHDRHRQRNE